MKKFEANFCIIDPALFVHFFFKDYSYNSKNK